MEELFHEVAFLFPPMSPQEYQELLVDIHEHGLREPISLHEGKIVDGVHRYRACRELGFEPTYQEWNGKGSLVAFVVSQNAKRRHLTSSQKVILALEIEPQLAKEAKRNQSLGGGDKKSGLQIVANPIREKVQAANQAAKAAGTNHFYVTDAKKIFAQAPELKEEVKQGTITIPEAKTLAHLRAEQRAEAVRQVKTGEVKTAKAAILEIKKAEVEAQAIAAPSKPSVAFASWERWLTEQPECDLLLTDPPYSSDIADIAGFAHSWLPVALSKVRPTGRAYVCIGAYPDELHAYLSVPVPAHLRRLNVLVWTYKNTLGPSPTHAYKSNWQAILYYAGVQAPPLDCPLLTEQFSVQEINAPDGRLGQHYHAWQKPDELAERLIRHSTKPGSTVMDCFSGTGTFLLAAHRLGRIGLGCDYSEAMLTIAEKRGCNVVRTAAQEERI